MSAGHAVLFMNYFRFRDVLPDSKKDLREFAQDSLTDSSGKMVVSCLKHPECHCEFNVIR